MLGIYYLYCIVYKIIVVVNNINPTEEWEKNWDVIYNIKDLFNNYHRNGEKHTSI